MPIKLKPESAIAKQPSRSQEFDELPFQLTRKFVPQFSSRDERNDLLISFAFYLVYFHFLSRSSTFSIFGRYLNSRHFFFSLQTFKCKWQKWIWEKKQKQNETKKKKRICRCRKYWQRHGAPAPENEYCDNTHNQIAKASKRKKFW